MIPLIVFGSLVLLVLIVSAAAWWWLYREDQALMAQEAEFWSEPRPAPNYGAHLIPLPEPDARTVAALDAVDALIEDIRQKTVVDPRFPDWVAEVLGCDSVASYIEKMTHQLRAAASA